MLNYSCVCAIDEKVEDKVSKKTGATEPCLLSWSFLFCQLPLITEIIMLMLTALLAFPGSRCQRFSREPGHSAKCQPPPRARVCNACRREMA